MLDFFESLFFSSLIFTDFFSVCCFFSSLFFLFPKNTIYIQVIGNKSCLYFIDVLLVTCYFLSFLTFLSSVFISLTPPYCSSNNFTTPLVKITFLYFNKSKILILLELIIFTPTIFFIEYFTFSSFLSVITKMLSFSFSIYILFKIPILGGSKSYTATFPNW